MATDVARQLTKEELEAGLEEIARSPASDGTVQLIVGRPAEGEREVLETAALDLVEGLVGDMWRARGSRRTPDGSANPNAQITVMNARAVDLVAAGDRERWKLAGDQLYVDFDISAANVPAGTRLALGTAVLEVTADPHTGCAKFVARFGHAAHRFVNSRSYRDLRLRGLNAKVAVAGTVRTGDTIRKL
jgi:MOSC domain-containing protein